LVAVASGDSGCIETDSCTQDVATDDVHELSLLQTEIQLHVSKTDKAKTETAPAKVSETDSAKTETAPAKAPAVSMTETAPAKASAVAKQSIKHADAVPLAAPLSEKWGLKSPDAFMCCAFVPLLLIAAYLINHRFESFKKGSDWSKYVAEFVGTFMLVFAVGCNVIVGDRTWGVTSVACTLMVVIYALGKVSGGNFNPAVSISLGLSNKMEWPQVCIYICVQLAAGICAAVSYSVMLGEAVDLVPKPGYTWVEAGFAELFYTFMLTFVVLNVAATKAHEDNQFYGLAIGFTVVAGGYGAGSISGGCFNPAIAFAVDASSYSQGFGNCLPYIVFEIMGCALAAAMFRVCRPEEFEDSQVNAGTSKLTSEFLGTFMLVLTVGLNVLNESPAGAFSIAASLMCMIFALNSVSGAHFNPAVTVAVCMRKKIEVPQAFLYICCQVAGGICAAITYTMLMHGQTVSLGPKVEDARKALAGEFIFTFLLCFVVLCVATVEQPLSEFFGLAIGACVIAGGYAIGGLSGGSLNPAVSAGLAITDWYKGGTLVHCFSYTAVEVLGGAVAAMVFSQTHPSECQKL